MVQTTGIRYGQWSARQGRRKIPSLPSSHLCLHYRLVFGIKDHAPDIASAWRGDLHAFMGGIVRTLGGVPEAVRWRFRACAFEGGTTSHALPLRCTARIEVRFLTMGP